MNMLRRTYPLGKACVLTTILLLGIGDRKVLGQAPPASGQQGVYVGGYSGGNNRGGSTGVYVGGNPASRDRGAAGGYYIGGYPNTSSSPGELYLNRGGESFPGEGTPPPSAPSSLSRNVPALLRIRVPAQAEIRFDGQKTAKTGTLREFVTPPLQPWKKYTYQIWVHWNDQGHPVDRLRQVTFRAGDLVKLDFREP